MEIAFRLETLQASHTVLFPASVQVHKKINTLPKDSLSSRIGKILGRYEAGSVLSLTVNMQLYIMKPWLHIVGIWLNTYWN